MPSFTKNPFVRVFFAGFALLVVIIIYSALTSLSSSSTGLGSSDARVSAVPQQGLRNNIAADSSLEYSGTGATRINPYPADYLPNPSGYVPNLEAFETTNYSLTGRIREFEAACSALTILKADQRYSFKELNSGLNDCSATFFTEEKYAEEALSQLTQFSGVTTNRSTESVTRHREQIQSQSSIVREQLQSVERTLTEAQFAYEEIAAFARAERDVSEYGNAIENKLRQIDQLTSRRISLTSQLDNLAQQAADLEERLGVIEISVSYSRSYTLNPDKTARDWEQAWQALSTTWTSFGIGLTAYFGIFLLLVVQYSLYGLVLILFARAGFKIARLIWKI